MKRKVISTLFILMFAGCAAWAETSNQISVAVIEVTGPQKTLNHHIEALLTANLSADDRFGVVDRAELSKVLAEQALGKSGNITPETAARIGQLTGAKILLTGREMMPVDNRHVVIIANIIGAETGKVFSQVQEIERKDLVAAIADVSHKVGNLITAQETNLLAPTALTLTRDKRAERIARQIAGKRLPRFAIKIDESDGSADSHVAETELTLLLQKTGFVVTNEKGAKPEVIISGDAVVGRDDARGNLGPYSAALSLKAKERGSGRVLALDFQRSTATAAGEDAGAHEALQNATDELAERFIPSLIQEKPQ